MAREDAMPHYERLIAAANARGGKQFIGHAVVAYRGPKRVRAIIPVFSSGAKLEPKLLKFMQQCLFGAMALK